MRVAMIGIQGIGKSTQCKLIATSMNGTTTHVSTGDLLREHIENKTEIGLSYEADYKKGLLASDDILFGIMGPALDGDKWILDGFPRSISQARWLCQEYKPDVVINLVVDDKDILVSRLLKRGRADDTPDGILTRMGIYEKNDADVLNVLLNEFGCKVNTVEISALDGPEKVMHRILLAEIS
jgi:adenylate kinase